MNLSKSWTIAANDLKVFRRKKNIVFSTIALSRVHLLLHHVSPPHYGNCFVQPGRREG
jgi:hypothetical protein